MFTWDNHIADCEGESGSLSLHRVQLCVPRVPLQVQADALRKLVRIKLADDNDLAAAQCALVR